MGFDAGGAPGRRHPLGAELNLVPYIDLLTCMVTFLLITAVWTQLARIDVAQRMPARDGAVAQELLPRLVVAVEAEGFVLDGTAGTRRIPRTAEGYDFAALRAALAEVHRLFPAKRDVQFAVADMVVHEDLVRAMDAAVAAQFPDINVSDLAHAQL